MAKSVRMELRTTPELAAAIDAARGDVPRNVWLERAAEAALGDRPSAGHPAKPRAAAGSTPATPAPVPRTRSVNAPVFNRATTLKR